MPHPDVSLVIVNFKTKELIRECIKSVLRYSHAVSYEVIVVDNSRDEGLEEMISSRFPDVTYLCVRRNLGYSAGVNVGITASRGRYILVMNPDITVLDGSIDSLVEYMEKHPEVGLAGPQLLNPNGSIQQSYYRFYSIFTRMFRRLAIGKIPFAKRHIDHVLMHDQDVACVRSVDWLLGACVIARRCAMDVVGTWDERFFLYFEDTDWSRRFWKNGWQVHYVPDVHMVHLFKRASAARSGLSALTQAVTWIHIASGIKYYLKHLDFYGRRPTP